MIKKIPDKEEFKNKALKIIQNNNSYTTQEDLTKRGIPQYIVSTLSLSVPELNAECGFFRDKRKQAVFADKESAEEAIIAYIKNTQCPVTIKQLLRVFNIDYDCTWNYFELNLQDLHNRAGVSLKHASTLEARIDKALQKIFGKNKIVSQKQFKECVSVRGYRLRFDFYIKNPEILIEVDGPAHFGGFRSTRTLKENDEIKNEFTKLKNIPLVRIKYSEFGAVEDDVDLLKSKLEVVKSFELLESLEGITTTT
jgi:very-short-patch-repair endonuclease